VPEQTKVDAIRVSQSEPALIGPQLRPPQPAVWQYQFRVQVAEYDYVFPIMVPENVPENQRTRTANQMFKEIFALIARKVAEF